MWILLSLLTACTNSVNTIIFKGLLRKTPSMVVALGSSLAAIPFLLLYISWKGPVALDPLFWVGLVSTGVLNVAGAILWFKALQAEDASLLAPVAAFNPLLTTVVSFVALRETPSLTGLIGIVSIVIGAILLGKIRDERMSVSLSQLLTRRGIRYMLIVYVLYSVTPTFEKIALLHSHPHAPALVALGISAFVAAGIAPIVARTTPGAVRALSGMLPILVCVGLFSAAGQIAAFAAFTSANLGYVTAVRKTDMFFIMLLATIFLKEKVTGNRWAGALFMFLGVTALAL